MAVQKLSQIASAPSNFATTDTLVGVRSGTTDLQFSQAQVTAGIKAVTVLQAPITYFVNASTGSDSNDGLSSGTAFKTLGKAALVIATWDLSGGFLVTINVADGTYVEQLLVPSCVGAQTEQIKWTGNVATPSNVHVIPNALIGGNITGVINSFFAVGNVFFGMWIDGTDAGFGGFEAVHAERSLISCQNCRLSIVDNDSWFIAIVVGCPDFDFKDCSFDFHGTQASLISIQQFTVVSLRGNITLNAGAVLSLSFFVDLLHFCLFTTASTLVGWGTSTGPKGRALDQSSIVSALAQLGGTGDPVLDNSSTFSTTGAISNIGAVFTNSGLPSAVNDIPVNQTWGVYKDTTGGGAYVSMDDGGAIKFAQLQDNLIQRVTTQFDKTNDAALANILGLSANVKAGISYKFTATLFTVSNAAGGVQAAIAGTCTATTIIYEGETTNAAAIGAQTRATALATQVGAVTAVTAARIDIIGFIKVANAGTLTVQFAQNVANGTASSVLVGSFFQVENMP